MFVVDFFSDFQLKTNNALSSIIFKVDFLPPLSTHPPLEDHGKMKTLTVRFLYKQFLFYNKSNQFKQNSRTLYPRVMV